LRDVSGAFLNTGEHDAEARIEIAGAKWNNFGILRLRRYRSNQDLLDALRNQITSASRPFLSWDYIGADRIGSE
jgi:hypothetical protein